MNTGSFNKKIPRLDIEDFRKRFQLLLKEISIIENKLQVLNLDFINKITGKLDGPQNNDYFVIRDSIYFRLSSMLLHLRLLDSIQKNHYKMINSAKDKQLELNYNVYKFLDEQFQIFDSIIFHSISLFDYLGNLTGFICIGNINMKWNGVMKSINDSKNLFSKFKLSENFRMVHSDLINKLYNYRSELIHYSKDSGGVQSNYNLLNNEIKFTVMAPKNFVKDLTSSKF